MQIHGPDTPELAQVGFSFGPTHPLLFQPDLPIPLVQTFLLTERQLFTQ